MIAPDTPSYAVLEVLRVKSGFSRLEETGPNVKRRTIPTESKNESERIYAPSLSKTNINQVRKKTSVIYNVLHKEVLENNRKVGIIIHDTTGLVICQVINKLDILPTPGDTVFGNRRVGLQKHRRCSCATSAFH